MRLRPNNIEAGDTAWCEEFGVVRVETIYPPDDVCDWWTVEVTVDGGHTETTDMRNLKAEIPVDRWEWKDTDAEMVFFYGYDPQDRHVVTRSFKLTATVQRGPGNLSYQLDAEPSWSGGIEAKKDVCGDSNE